MTEQVTDAGLIMSTPMEKSEASVGNELRNKSHSLTPKKFVRPPSRIKNDHPKGPLGKLARSVHQKLYHLTKGTNPSQEEHLQTVHNGRWRAVMMEQNHSGNGSIAVSHDGQMHKGKTGRWKAAVTMYYYHTLTKEVTFQRPKSFVEWKVAMDNHSGRPYYYNTITKETTWIKPEGVRERNIPSEYDTPNGDTNDDLIDVEHLRARTVSPESILSDLECAEREDMSSVKATLGVFNNHRDSSFNSHHMSDTVPTMNCLERESSHTRLSQDNVTENANRERLHALLQRFFPGEKDKFTLFLTKVYGTEMSIIEDIEDMITETPFDQRDQLRGTILCYIHSKLKEMVDGPEDGRDRLASLSLSEPIDGVYPVKDTCTGSDYCPVEILYLEDKNNCSIDGVSPVKSTCIGSDYCPVASPKGTVEIFHLEDKNNCSIDRVSRVKVKCTCTGSDYCSVASPQRSVDNVHLEDKKNCSELTDIFSNTTKKHAETQNPYPVTSTMDNGVSPIKVKCTGCDYCSVISSLGSADDSHLTDKNIFSDHTDHIYNATNHANTQNHLPVHSIIDDHNENVNDVRSKIILNMIAINEKMPLSEITPCDKIIDIEKDGNIISTSPLGRKLELEFKILSDPIYSMTNRKDRPLSMLPCEVSDNESDYQGSTHKNTASIWRDTGIFTPVVNLPQNYVLKTENRNIS